MPWQARIKFAEMLFAESDGAGHARKASSEERETLSCLRVLDPIDCKGRREALKLAWRRIA